MAHFSSLSFPQHTHPKGSTLQTSVLALQPTGWFLLIVFLFFVSDIPHVRFNDTDFRRGFSACPDFAVHRPSTFDPAFDLGFAHVIMCKPFPYYHRSRLRGSHRIVVKYFLFQVCFVCHLEPFTAASDPFLSFRLIVEILCIRVCLVCVFLLSITTDSARLLSLRRPNRGDIVSFGFVQRVPPSTTADSVCLLLFRLSNRGYTVILVAFVLY